MPLTEVSYSLGFNFDPALIEGLLAANEIYGGSSRINEVFGALPDCPISSARPISRIPPISWREFSRQLESLGKANIEFNFLMNTAHAVGATLPRAVAEYLKRLADVGVHRLTVGTPELCRLVKAHSPQFHLTLSITYGIHTAAKLSKAESAGADAVYLDGVYVNRNFLLLRALRKQATAECRLYANMSCISHCPVVRRHYNLFAGSQSALTARQNDAFFAGCTLIKLANPVEWIQMPWIRPEDICVYVSEGIKHFKLADRLATTETLLIIAQAYLKRTSPKDLFTLMERDGAKYRALAGESGDTSRPAISVINSEIPADFIQHFQLGDCISNNLSCELCLYVAQKAVRINHAAASARPPADLVSLIPLELQRRTALSEHNDGG
jgi:hypothetical protein